MELYEAAKPILEIIALIAEVVLILFLLLVVARDTRDDCDPLHH